MVQKIKGYRYILEVILEIWIDSAIEKEIFSKKKSFFSETSLFRQKNQN